MREDGRVTRIFTLLALLVALAVMTMTVSAEPETALSKTKLTLFRGKTAQLSVSGTESTVKWSSSKKSVATVNKKGKVTAKKKGTAVITAKVDGVKYRCKVTVKQLVTSVKLNQKKVTITEGKTYTLKATVKPTNANNRAVAWSSSDPSVVTVSAKGKLKAVGPGTATITAKAKDGSGKKATCKLQVKAKKKTASAASIALDESALTLAVGQSGTLKATTADNTRVAWGSSDTSVVTVLNGKVTAKKAGSAVIAARRLDGTKTVYCKITVKEKETAAVSAAGESALARKFLNVLQKYSDQVKSDKAAGLVWSYSNSSAKSTWSAAVTNVQSKGITYCNCALLPRWGLRELGIINSKNFWGLVGGGIQYRGDVKEQLLRHCEIIEVYKTPSQLLAEGNLLPGDICTWVEYQHTNVYAGDGLWYDSGRNGAIGGYTGGKFVFDSFGPAATVNMSGTTVGYIIRLVK